LGHILLHEWSEDIETLSKDEFKERESQAHAFASAFLLPKEAFGSRHTFRWYNYTMPESKRYVSIPSFSFSQAVVKIPPQKNIVDNDCN
jgi:Zn-dependent peptidase ImmA (M78 family)